MQKEPPKPPPGAAPACISRCPVRQRSPDPHLCTPASLKPFFLSLDILPKQETFPETDARNCTKATSITGLSFTARGNVWGFSVSPALVSASGTTTCGNTGKVSSDLSVAALLAYRDQNIPPGPGSTDFQGQGFISRPSFIIITNMQVACVKTTQSSSGVKDSCSAVPRCAQSVGHTLQAHTRWHPSPEHWVKTTLNPRTFSWLEVTHAVSYELADAVWAPNSESRPFSCSFSSRGLSQANKGDWERRQRPAFHP